MSVHPYIPNTVPEVKKEMLREIGLTSIDELYRDIPDQLKLKDKMNLPPALSELELKKHIESILSRNIGTNEYVSFLGGGCWNHYVPAICDEISQRSEFVTAYAGEPYEDFGRFQALFEYQSLMAELVDMDVVNVPTFDWAQAAATSLRMASRLTGRFEVLVPRQMDPDKYLIIRNYLTPDITVVQIDHDPETGLMDLADLKKKLSEETAAVYFENPSFWGIIEHQASEISKLAHQVGAQSVVGVDPISLGILAAPSEYGADIVCGDLQPLGIRMQFGGGQAGFIATRNEEAYVMEFPSRIFGIAPTAAEGEYGFGDVAYERTSFAKREKGKESVGTQTALWGIVAGVYLSLMGPNGMKQLGTTIMQKSQYAAKRLSTIQGVSVKFSSPFFKEFVVDFQNTGKTVSEINQFLLTKGILGGKDLSMNPDLGQCALYCVTEMVSKDDIDHLVHSLKNWL